MTPEEMRDKKKRLTFQDAAEMIEQQFGNYIAGCIVGKLTLDENKNVVNVEVLWPPLSTERGEE